MARTVLTSRNVDLPLRPSTPLIQRVPRSNRSVLPSTLNRPSGPPLSRQPSSAPPERSNPSTPGTLEAEIEFLTGLNIPELRRRWQLLFKRPPPAYASQSLMVQALAHNLQERTLGSLKLRVRRALAQAYKELTSDKPPGSTKPGSLLKPGTRLLREWHGDTYEVVVLEDGVLYQGQHYGSLSEVARIITGCNRSGHKFFRPLVKRAKPSNAPQANP